MTSPCELQLYSNDEHKARNLAKEILAMSKALENKYNFYNPDSYLNALNNRTTNHLDIQTKDLLTRAKLFYTKTNGIFDVTMGTLSNARRKNTTLAIESEVEKLTPYLGVEHFKIKKETLIFSNPYTRIDLGGFVKEFAVDQAVKILKKHKIKSALVNFGGDLYALGLKPSGDAFTIGIKNPHNTNEYLTHVSITNEALTTSASYERNHTVETKSYSHIIAQGSLQQKIISATVIAPSVVEAGVYSTSLMIDPTLSTGHKQLLINDVLEVLT